jgi:hypothetical protein
MLLRILLALFMAGAILMAGVAILSALSRPSPAADTRGTTTRRLYYCTACGAELVEVRAGRPEPPLHCGDAMRLREELTEA